MSRLRGNKDIDVEKCRLRLTNLINKKITVWITQAIFIKVYWKNIISNALEYTTEPYIGNHNEEFLSGIKAV